MWFFLFSFHRRFDPTYKELKQDGSRRIVAAVRGFDPTYKELKHDAFTLFGIAGRSEF